MLPGFFCVCYHAGPMPDSRHDWVTLRVASQRLGRSPETIRRQIRQGTFEYPHERLPLAAGSNRDRFVVGLPKDTPDATQRNVTPQDATDPADVARIVLGAFQDGMAAQREHDATRRNEDATRIVEQAQTISRLTREIESLDATAAELARQVVEAESRAADLAAQLDAERRRPWWRRWLR